jgi:hypothetical protein
MARSALNAVSLPTTGYNVTDSADFAVMATGANNGKEIVYNGAVRILLKNTTGGAAVFTIKVPTPAQYTAIGLTLSDMTVTVAAGKTWELKPHAAMKQADGKIYIDCDVAASILVLE